MASLSVSSDGLQTLLEEVGAKAIPSFSSTDNQNCPMDIYKSYLAEILVQITECEPQVAYESITWPGDSCDLAVVLPRLRVKDLKPNELAVEINKNFPHTPLFSQPFHDGNHLRVFFSPKALARVILPYIVDRGSSYGTSHFFALQQPDAVESRRNKVVVEFSSPNIGKEFDGNHLRSTIIGAFIASLYKNMGWDVVRMNFLGDWGQNIGLLAVGWSRFGSEELFEQDPLKHLAEVDAQIEELFRAEQAARKLRAEGDENVVIETDISAEKDEFFKKMEDGDPDALALWKRFRDVSIEKYIDLYARLNITFDEYSGESTVSQKTIAEVESILKEKGVSEDNGEAWVIDFNKHGHRGLATPKLRSANGTTSYLLRDIAAVLERERIYGFDKMIYVVSAKQDTHFKQVFSALELMGLSDLASKLQHVSFGSFKGPAPKSGILLDDVLEQCQTSIKELLKVDPGQTKEFQGGYPKLPETLGVTALMVQDLSSRRVGNFTFDIQKIPVTDGHTGLNLQQWYVALCSKLKGTTIPRDELRSADYSLFGKDDYSDVVRFLIQFPSIVKSAFKPMESQTILTYLFRLIDLLGVVWPNEEDEGAGESSSSQNLAELALFESVKLVLENGMRILGLMPLQLNDGESFCDSAIDVAERAPVSDQFHAVEETSHATKILGETSAKESTAAELTHTHEVSPSSVAPDSAGRVQSPRRSRAARLRLIAEHHRALAVLYMEEADHLDEESHSLVESHTVEEEPPAKKEKPKIKETPPAGVTQTPEAANVNGVHVEATEGVPGANETLHVAETTKEAPAVEEPHTSEEIPHAAETTEEIPAVEESHIEPSHATDAKVAPHEIFHPEEIPHSEVAHAEIVAIPEVDPV